MAEKVAQLSVSLESEVNVNLLLKEDTKASKLEMALLKEHVAKEEEKFNKER